MHHNPSHVPLLPRPSHSDIGSARLVTPLPLRTRCAGSPRCSRRCRGRCVILTMVTTACYRPLPGLSRRQKTKIKRTKDTQILIYMIAEKNRAIYGRGRGGRAPGAGRRGDWHHRAQLTPNSAFAALKADGSIAAWGDSAYGGSGRSSPSMVLSAQLLVFKRRLISGCPRSLDFCRVAYE